MDNVQDQTVGILHYTDKIHYNYLTKFFDKLIGYEFKDEK